MSSLVFVVFSLTLVVNKLSEVCVALNGVVVFTVAMVTLVFHRVLMEGGGVKDSSVILETEACFSFSS